MFEYGKILASLPSEVIFEAFGDALPSRRWARLGKLYFHLFGYPDVSGHLRFRKVMQRVNPRQGERILDVGCGNGIYTMTFAKDHTAICDGIDMDGPRIERNYRLAQALGLPCQFHKMDAANLQFPDSTFDKVVCIEVLEHIRDDIVALQGGYSGLEARLCSQSPEGFET